MAAPALVRPLLVLALFLTGCFQDPCVTPPHYCVGAWSGDKELPPLAWEGERVVFGSNVLDEVCVGTVAALDATVESIEQELSLPPTDEKIPFYLLDDVTFFEHCPWTAVACVPGVRGSEGLTVYSSALGMDAKRHELVHARLEGLWGRRLLGEGIAAALDSSGGCLASESCFAADLDTLLQGDFGIEGYNAGSDLVHGLLVDHGPEAVLAFMDMFAGGESPDEVRALYLDHFGSVLDDDFQAYMRGPFDDYTVAQRGCDALIPAPPSGDAGGIAVEATMDCSSPEVVNAYGNPDAGRIEWTFTVTDEQSGAFTISWSPEHEYLRLRPCSAPVGNWQESGAQMGGYNMGWMSSSDTTTLLLAPGQYKFSWTALFDSSIDVTITPPCTFELGDCPAGQQCNIWNECLSEVTSPATLGESCEQVPGAPLACSAGSRCVGGLCVAECDATVSCNEGEACSRSRVCGQICSLLAQDCDAGFTCLPSADESLTDSGSGVCIAAGEGQLLERCDWRQSECAEGLSCEAWKAACVPLCDPYAPDSGCPEEAPICNPFREGPAGFCRTKRYGE